MKKKWFSLIGIAMVCFVVYKFVSNPSSRSMQLPKNYRDILGYSKDSSVYILLSVVESKERFPMAILLYNQQYLILLNKIADAQQFVQPRIDGIGHFLSVSPNVIYTTVGNEYLYCQYLVEKTQFNGKILMSFKANGLKNIRIDDSTLILEAGLGECMIKYNENSHVDFFMKGKEGKTHAFIGLLFRNKELYFLTITPHLKDVTLDKTTLDKILVN